MYRIAPPPFCSPPRTSCLPSPSPSQRHLFAFISLDFYTPHAFLPYSSDLRIEQNRLEPPSWENNNARRDTQDTKTEVLTKPQKKVYTHLLLIPPGRVTSYATLARTLCTSPRAIGGALRNNPYAPDVPCHRVIASDGFVGGFMGDCELASLYSPFHVLSFIASHFDSPRSLRCAAFHFPASGSVNLARQVATRGRDWTRKTPCQRTSTRSSVAATHVSGPALVLQRVSVAS